MADLGIVTDATIQKIPDTQEYRGGDNFIMYLAQQHSLIESWDGNPAKRDKELVQFVMREPFLASAIMSIAMTRAALSWELSGPPKTVAEVQKILNSADFKAGWQNLMMKVNTDLLTTENGAFIEVIRKPPTAGRSAESMPVIGIAHLSSLQCILTGNPLEPVIYIDADGVEHIMKWYQVIHILENPVPRSRVNRQYCFVSRVLKFAQIVVDIETHHAEKIGGRFSKAIHIVSGPNRGELENVQNMAKIDADNAGIYKYGAPVILTTLDPNARVTKETIELASLPDGFDLDQMLNWYITLLALASGSDYQEFAPLSSGNLGTASQSDTLHRKAQRKGTQMFIKLLENSLVQSKVIPPTVAFRFKQQDAQAEMEAVEIQQMRANTRAGQIASGEITPEVARQIAVDTGDLKQEYLLMMQQQDETPNITVADDESVSEEFLKESAPVGIDMAWAVARWFSNIVESHQLQAISPIPAPQVVVFTEALRNEIKSAGTIGTTDVWLSDTLLKAAKEAGIHPMALRSRLPNNYEVYVNGKIAKDNRGSTIYITKEKPATKKQYQVPVLEGVCYECGTAGTKTLHHAIYGWTTACDKHGVGLTFTEPTINKYDVINTYKAAYVGTEHKLMLSLAAMRLLAELNNKTIDVQQFAKPIQKLIQFTDSPDLVVMKMLELTLREHAS